ncbi:type II toxin-antitoxin system PemK/MazF family toxin [Candidatus Acetothermia bacterium]|nr:type II toxin-antitoxin system PemK/MazF family toxin [Candidatus Acetothermia bacterium]
MTSSSPQRGEIWLAKILGERKRRPCLILSADWLNRFAHDVSVVPITTVKRKAFPTRIELDVGEGGLREQSWAKCDQVTTIDKQRLGRAALGRLSSVQLVEIEDAVRRALKL